MDPPLPDCVGLKMEWPTVICLNHSMGRFPHLQWCFGTDLGLSLDLKETIWRFRRSHDRADREIGFMASDTEF
jgi:hypothetical protein